MQVRQIAIAKSGCLEVARGMGVISAGSRRTRRARLGGAGRLCRVEMWRGGFRLGISVTGPFGRRCLTSFAMLRFHIPLIKPGVPFSGTRLSDKAVLHILLHTFAHERLPFRSLQLV